MDVISKLLNRAELLAERGQSKMVNSLLDEVDRRAERQPLDQDQLLQYQRLEKMCAAADGKHPEEIKCHKCQGSGEYFRNGGPNGRCFACVGKGWQSERDKVREQNYYARRQNSQVPAYDPGF